ncbi:hypothetical protein [Actinoplanes siamensis]|uniref:Uncharacterized protein n=1 Tax=Actinoplanes siamensis TaxID=1223317 RepID=A0A919NFF3_9ACTN|nr:hypothetical protein [Actinoplanes siamensis]GIF09873.1 hypothetical protein Asi03nite_74110 [Actinoplanes siamensis]
MGNDSDFGIPPFAAISDRDEQILQEARRARITVHPDDYATIWDVIEQTADSAPATDEDHEDLVMQTLIVDHGVDEAEWGLRVLVVMAQWRHAEVNN